jgi:hypothetical protein
MEEKKEETKFYYYQLSTIVLNELGPEAGAVHAIINDYCRDGRFCSLSSESIGNLSHMSYKRVKRMLALLMQHGYIKKLDYRNGYGTNSYEVIFEKTDSGIFGREMSTLKSNDIRIANGRESRKKYLENRKKKKDESYQNP